MRDTHFTGVNPAGVAIDRERVDKWQVQHAAYVQCCLQLHLDEEAQTANSLQAEAKVQRLKACDWVVAPNSFLASSTGIGLKRFVAQNTLISGFEKRVRSLEQPAEHEGKPVVSIHMDQGSYGWSGAMYLLNCQKLRIAVMPDCFHRRHNALNVGVCHAGLWYSVVLRTIVFNLSFGPWCNDQWFQEQIEAALAMQGTVHIN